MIGYSLYYNIKVFFNKFIFNKKNDDDKKILIDEKIKNIQKKYKRSYNPFSIEYCNNDDTEYYCEFDNNIIKSITTEED